MVANFHFLKTTNFANINIMCCVKLLIKHSQLFEKNTKKGKKIYNDKILGFFRSNIVVYTSQNVVHLILNFLVFKPYD
jgi:hypothetical protein